MYKSLMVLLLLWPAIISADTLSERLDRTLEVAALAGFAGYVDIREGDRVVYQRGIGEADRERRIPWSNDVFGTVGSISKQYTAAAILSLVASHDIDLDTPVVRWLPGIDSAITLRHLLTHSGGLPDMAVPDRQWVDRDELIAFAKAQSPAFVPGTRYDYSNLGYSILAIVVEEISGQPYQTYLREQLFKPAGIEQTGYGETVQGESSLAVGYFDDGRVFGNMRDDMYHGGEPSWVLRGNGGMYAANDDLVAWVRALAANRVLPAAWVQQMWAPQIDESNGEGGSYYGYGWVTVDASSLGRLILHNGDDGEGTFFNDFAYAPEHDLSFIVRSNSYRTYPEVESLLGNLLRSYVAHKKSE